MFLILEWFYFQGRLQTQLVPVLAGAGWRTAAQARYSALTCGVSPGYLGTFGARQSRIK